MIGTMSIVIDPAPPQVASLDDALIPLETTATLDSVAPTISVESTSTTVAGAGTSTTIR
jgi:hypothetical protein